jgi:hypothetical protein
MGKRPVPSSILLILSIVLFPGARVFFELLLRDFVEMIGAR